MPKCSQHNGKLDKQVPDPWVSTLVGKTSIMHADTGNSDTERLKTMKPDNVSRVNYRLLLMRCLEGTEP